MAPKKIKLSILDKIFSSRAEKKIKNWIEQRRSTVENGINIGCGNHPIKNLVNIDKFSSHADLKIDISDLESHFTNGVEHIEAHHVLEHLSFLEVNQFLTICKKIMCSEKNATLILTSPDMKKVCKLLQNKRFHKCDGNDCLPYVWKMIYGSQEHEGMYHKSGFTQEYLEMKLQEFGFHIVFSYSPFPQRSTPSLCVIAQSTPVIK
jgi:predicted SAM-dependent methyltransferase